ncbi:hypothetical protein B296_00045058 [Ensete ventricosum]|uniref:Uncharacterized protein n=1 Tax=Ensete ventricosum TaxID=4639 RepID=A0A426X916_ENSVE|nr:hypothetical protein B296_00045058 [Ensete ventricosum]
MVGFAIPLLRRGAGAFIVSVIGHSYLISLLPLFLTIPSYLSTTPAVLAVDHVGGPVVRGRKDVAARTISCTNPGDLAERVNSGTNPGDSAERVNSSTNPGDLVERANSGTNPGDLAERVNSGKNPGDLVERANSDANPGDFAERANSGTNPRDLVERVNSCINPRDLAERVNSSTNLGDLVERVNSGTNPRDLAERVNSGTNLGDSTERVNSSTNPGDLVERANSGANPGDFAERANSGTNPRDLAERVNSGINPGDSVERVNSSTNLGDLVERANSDTNPGDLAKRVNSGTNPGDLVERANLGTNPMDFVERANSGTNPGDLAERGNSSINPGDLAERANSGTNPGDLAERVNSCTNPGDLTERVNSGTNPRDSTERMHSGSNPGDLAERMHSGSNPEDMAERAHTWVGMTSLDSSSSVRIVSSPRSGEVSRCDPKVGSSRASSRPSSLFNARVLRDLEVMKADHDLDTTVIEGPLTVIREWYSIPIEYELHVPQPGQRPYSSDARASRWMLWRPISVWGLKLDWSAHPIGNASPYLSKEESVLVGRLKGILSSSCAIKEMTELWLVETDQMDLSDLRGMPKVSGGKAPPTCPATREVGASPAREAPKASSKRPVDAPAEQADDPTRRHKKVKVLTRRHKSRLGEGDSHSRSKGKEAAAPSEEPDTPDESEERGTSLVHRRPRSMKDLFKTKVHKDDAGYYTL